MIQGSIIYFLFFLAIALLVYYLVPQRFKNLVLLAASLLFLAWGRPIYILLILASITLNYICGLEMERHRDRRIIQRNILILAVAVNLGMLAVFRYAGFFAGILGSLVSGDISFAGFAVPIGISVYTLQAISYVVDLYRGEMKAQRNLIDLALCIAMFPQMAAGPIVRYRQMEGQLHKREFSWNQIGRGVVFFVIGLAKATILASGIGSLFEEINDLVAASQAPPLTAWIGAAAFMLQIYFFFSGFSDMALGLASLFGFRFRRNFHDPYLSKSIRQFGLRWNRSLNLWFRDYVYAPLEGDHVRASRHVLNLLISCLLTGFWYGASWNFLFWGIYFGAFFLLETYVWGKALRRLPAFVQHLYSLIVVLIGWVFFFSGTFGDAFHYLGTMFGAVSRSGSMQTAWYFLTSNWLLLLAGVVCCSAIPAVVAARIRNPKRRIRIGIALLAALFVISFSQITSQTARRPLLRTVTHEIAVGFDRLGGSREENGVFRGKGGQLLADIASPNEEDLECKVEGINRYAQEYPDVTTRVMLVPDAAQIYPEKLPAFAVTDDQGAYFDDIRRNLDHDIVWMDAVRAMEGSGEETFYYQTDSLWTTEGAYRVFLETASDLGIDDPGEVSYEVLCASCDFHGTLAEQSGFLPAKEETIEVYLPEEQTSVLVTYVEEQIKSPSLYSTEALDGKDPYGVFLDGTHPLIEIETAAESTRVLLVAKDSFANCYIPFLIPYFGKIIVVDPSCYNGDIATLTEYYGVTDTLFLYGGNSFFEAEDLCAFLDFTM